MNLYFEKSFVMLIMIFHLVNNDTVRFLIVSMCYSNDNQDITLAVVILLYCPTHQSSKGLWERAKLKVFLIFSIKPTPLFVNRQLLL